MAKRIYVVTGGDKRVFVNASNKSAAIGFVARNSISAKVASQRDLLGLNIEDIFEAGDLIASEPLPE